MKAQLKQREKEKIFYEHQAQIYVQVNGLREYRIEDKYLIYNVSHKDGLIGTKRTIQYKIDLDTLQPTYIKPLKRFDKKGLLNNIGTKHRYQ